MGGQAWQRERATRWGVQHGGADAVGSDAGLEVLRQGACHQRRNDERTRRCCVVHDADFLRGCTRTEQRPLVHCSLQVNLVFATHVHGCSEPLAQTLVVVLLANFNSMGADDALKASAKLSSFGLAGFTSDEGANLCVDLVDAEVETGNLCLLFLIAVTASGCVEFGIQFRNDTGADLVQ